MEPGPYDYLMHQNLLRTYNSGWKKPRKFKEKIFRCQNFDRDGGQALTLDIDILSQSLT